MNTALVKLQRKGQMVIPRSLREQAGVDEGTLLEVSVLKGGRLLLTPQVTVDRALVADAKRDRKQLLQALAAAVNGVRGDAQRAGLDKLTSRQVESEVAASRRAQPKKRAKSSAK